MFKIILMFAWKLNSEIGKISKNNKFHLDTLAVGILTLNLRSAKILEIMLADHEFCGSVHRLNIKT